MMHSSPGDARTGWYGWDRVTLNDRRPAQAGLHATSGGPDRARTDHLFHAMPLQPSKMAVFQAISWRDHTRSLHALHQNG